MRRGELYKVIKGSRDDPKKSRVFVIVGRQVVIDSKFSTIACAPVYTAYDGLSTQVPVGIDEGLKHESAIHCDELVSIQKIKLTDFIGSLSQCKLSELASALSIALDIEP